MIADIASENMDGLMRTRRFKSLWHLLLWPVLILAAIGVLGARNLSDMMAALFFGTAALTGLIAVKFWFWGTCAQLRLDSQLKEVRLEIAEMKELLKKTQK